MPTPLCYPGAAVEGLEGRKKKNLNCPPPYVYSLANPPPLHPSLRLNLSVGRPGPHHRSSKAGLDGRRSVGRRCLSALVEQKLHLNLLFQPSYLPFCIIDLPAQVAAAAPRWSHN